MVRLRGGDFAQETVFSDDPTKVARVFVAAGARWIHLVDLDGARDGSQPGRPARPADRRGGGGCRLRDRRRAARPAGRRRSPRPRAPPASSIGTAALRRPGFAGELIGTFGARRIAVALDVRDGLAIGEAWRAGAPGWPVDSVLERLAGEGVTTFEVTAIARDGGLSGPDLELLTRLVRLGRGQVIASGGIRSIDDLVAIRNVGCSGAIVGRALYEGGLDLAAALATLVGR